MPEDFDINDNYLTRACDAMQRLGRMTQVTVQQLVNGARLYNEVFHSVDSITNAISTTQTT